MAFPTISAITSTGSLSSGTPAALTNPSGTTTGDRLIAIVAFDNDDDPLVISGSGTGWSKLQQVPDTDPQNIGLTSAVFEKLAADGDDALTISTSGNTGPGELGTYIVLRIASGSHDASQAAELDYSGVNDDAPDAPNLTPSWGSADTLWVWAAAWDNATRTISAYPTNYGSNNAVNYGTGTSATVAVAVASRELAASSENPGAATISAGDNWNAWTIAVKPAGGGGGGPTITDQPDPDSAVEGDPASFTVAATGTGTLSYQWQEDDGGGWANVTNGGAYSGATTVTLTIDPTALSMDGYLYRCNVTDDDGTTASNSAELTVTAAPTGPTIDTQPSNQTVTEGATATFTVAATTSGGSLSYQWQRNPGGVGSWANVTTGTGGTTASYTTAATTVSGGDANNTDTWRCNVTDDNGTTTSSAATLTVNAASTNDIRLQPSMLLERGAYAASRTVSRWWVMTADLTAVAHTGTSAATNSTGQPTIDIVDSVYEVGDNVPMMFSEWTTETSELDRTTRGTPIIWVPAIAIP